MVNLTINNDEIEKISKRIHELQQLKKDNGRFTDEEQFEYQSLFEIKNILVKANQIENPSRYIVGGTMRVSSSDALKLFDLLDKVNVDLDVTRPMYLGEFVPGTKIGLKMPRSKRDNESFEDYEDYLYNYYFKNNELSFEPQVIKYHPGTIVPMLREPYPHEMYFETEDGYQYDDKYLGKKNAYYVSLSKYYDGLLAIERKRIREEALDRLSSQESALDQEQPLKVVNVEKLPKNYIAGPSKAVKEEVVQEQTRVKVVNVEPIKQTSRLDLEKLNSVVEDAKKRDEEELRRISKPVFTSASKKGIKKIEEANSEIIAKAAIEAKKLISGLNGSYLEAFLETEEREQSETIRTGLFRQKSSGVNVSDYDITDSELQFFQEISLDQLPDVNQVSTDESLEQPENVSDGEAVVDSYEQTIYSSIPKDVIVSAGVVEIAKKVNPSASEVAVLKSALSKKSDEHPEHANVYDALASQVPSTHQVSMKPTKLKVTNVESVPVVSSVNIPQEGLMSSFVPFEEIRELTDDEIIALTFK